MAGLEQNVEKNVAKNIAKMEAQLRLWNAKLDELVARTVTAGQGLKLDARKRLEDLKLALEDAQQRLAEARKAGAGQWESLRAAVEAAWKQAEASFKKHVD